MRRYLVVANQTLGGSELAAKVRECVAAGPCFFHILVPATPPKEQLVWNEGEAEAIAQSRLEEALARFREQGAEADGEVGDKSPLTAIGDVLSRGSFEEIISSTLPPGLSRWLGQDLPSRVERGFDLPVTHIIGSREPHS